MTDFRGGNRSVTGTWEVTVRITTKAKVGSWQVADTVMITLPKTLTYRQALKAVLKRVRTEP